MKELFNIKVTLLSYSNFLFLSLPPVQFGDDDLFSALEDVSPVLPDNKRAKIDIPSVSL